MKVGVYVGDRAPEQGGGHTIQSDILTSLAELRQETKHEFVVLADGAPPPWARGMPSLDLHSTPFATARHGARRLRRGDVPGRRRWRPSRRDALLGQSDIDVVWCLHPGSPSRELPYITIVWDLQHRLQPYFPEVSAEGEWRRREDFWREELGRAARVIVGTDAGLREIAEFFGVPPERARVLRHPTPSFALSAGAGDTSVVDRLFPAAPYVLYPAQFWSHKNHLTVLRAVRALRDSGEPTHAVFVGGDKGNLRFVQEEAARLGVSDLLHVEGFVSRDQLVALYRNATALVYVTLFGPENLPPLEAFALDCPVVGSRVAGAEEQLGGAALLVDPTDHAAVAAAVGRLTADPALRRALIARGRARAQEWTSAHFVRGVFEVLDELEPHISTWRSV